MICKGVIVQTIFGKQGKVLSIDKAKNVVLVRTPTSTISTNLNNVKFISYKGFEE